MMHGTDGNGWFSSTSVDDRPKDLEYSSAIASRRRNTAKRPTNDKPSATFCW